jgi:DNA processing protein
MGTVPRVHDVFFEHMFGSRNLVTSRETAAVLALTLRRDLAWNRVAGMVEDTGSAIALLAEMEQATPEQLFSDSSDERPSLDSMQALVEQWEAEGIHVLSVVEDAYPVNLRTVHDRPPVLFVRGMLEDRDERSVAVVGTRSASDQGLEFASAFATGLSQAGYVVVSGLAAGVDTTAHVATLEAGGRTVAVIGTGHRHAFPKENASLQEQLCAQSAVISQFWPDQEARRWTFPQRNAVMSGFAQATVVIEASHTSGAKMQARLALEHGRPVFLLNSLLEHPWAQDYAERAGTYVVDDPRQVVEKLERLYSDESIVTP